MKKNQLLSLLLLAGLGFGQGLSASMTCQEYAEEFKAKMEDAYNIIMGTGTNKNFNKADALFKRLSDNNYIVDEYRKSPLNVASELDKVQITKASTMNPFDLQWADGLTDASGSPLIQEIENENIIQERLKTGNIKLAAGYKIDPKKLYLDKPTNQMYRKIITA